MKKYSLLTLLVSLIIVTGLQGCRTTISPNGKVTIDNPAARGNGHNHSGIARGTCHRHNRVVRHCHR